MIPQSHVPKVSALTRYFKENMLRLSTIAFLIPLSFWLFFSICKVHQINPLKASYKYSGSYFKSSGKFTSIKENRIEYQYDGDNNLFITHHSMKPHSPLGTLTKRIDVSGNLIVIEEDTDVSKSTGMYHYQLNYAVTGLLPDQYIVRIITRDGEKVSQREYSLDLTSKLVNYLSPRLFMGNEILKN